MSISNPNSNPERTPTWRERHALKLLGVLMLACFATVIVAQTAC
jgi:hypothetical protein